MKLHIWVKSIVIFTHFDIAYTAFFGGLTKLSTSLLYCRTSGDQKT